MRLATALCAVLSVTLVPSIARGRSSLEGHPLPYQRPIPLDLTSPTPGGLQRKQIVSQDTTWYGDYQIIGGEYYARSSSRKSDVVWTFDRGNGPTGDPNVLTNGEGWKAEDLTANTVMYFRVIDNTLNLGGPAAPIIDGAKSLWVGADKPQSDALCWCGGAGYGNNWCQRITSESLAYNGAGSVTLSLKYFNHTEPCYDGTQIYLKRADNTELMLNPYPAGTCTDNLSFAGGFTDSIGSWQPAGGVHPGPATYARAITTDEIGGTQNIKIIIEFSSDGGASDEDCGEGSTGFRGTIWGPFGADDITINGGGISKSYTFETGLQNWTPGFCTPKGLYVQINDVGNYTILDPCGCRLSGNIMTMHAGVGDAGTHPVGQHVMAESPICDLGNSDLKAIFLEGDVYVELPRENGVLYRPGWKYYPYLCDATGQIGWSPRVGQTPYDYHGSQPLCFRGRAGATDVLDGVPVPPDAEKVIAIIELLSSCSVFTIPNCTGITNFTPLFDNLVVGATRPSVDAPQISINAACAFQDVGSAPSGFFDPRAPGPADVTAERSSGDGRPNITGDSLVVTGPLPGSDPNNRWEARLWWRVARRAPFQSDRANGADTRYRIWRDRVADGKKIDRPYRPEFTFGWMDSVQVGPVVSRNKFQSTFRENDDDFVGEGNPENEMIWDDVLFPGSRIDYFITSNYVGTPTILFYLPDTTGGNFLEFEILPGLRLAKIPNCGSQGESFCAYCPATLYICLQKNPYAENALRTILNGYPPCTGEKGCEIPSDRNWDRYDYQWSSMAPFARGAVSGSNNGMTLYQILGYRAILLDLLNYGAGVTSDTDYDLYGQWLASSVCGSNTSRQVFVANGTKVGEVLDALPNGSAFLSNILGATLLCDAFNGHSEDPNCAPVEDAFCLRYLPVSGGPFGTDLDVDAYGNGCPYNVGFNVYSSNGTGVGNRYYSADGGFKQMQYAQVVNQNLGPDANWRTVLDGASWYAMTRRDPWGSGESLCPRDTPSIIAGAIAEMGAELKWGFGVSSYDAIPKLTSAQEMATCQGTWNLPADVDAANGSPLVDRLYQNEPNPFNPRTTIHFSTARAGRVEILIYDVGGRLVRRLVSKRMEVGAHSVVWDGTNDSGAEVGSGVYWSKMKVGSFVSNKKLVVLK